MILPQLNFVIRKILDDLQNDMGSVMIVVKVLSWKQLQIRIGDIHYPVLDENDLCSGQYTNLNTGEIFYGCEQ